jgi:hypothetical protein
VRQRIRGSVLATAAIMALALISMPATAAAKPKAHLLVTSLKVISSPAERVDAALPNVILESDLHGHFALEYTIKNVGKAKSRTKHAGIYINAPQFGTQQVGPIAAGKAKTFTTNLDLVFTGPGWPYYAQVCITRNCSTDVPFSAVPRRWVVDSFSTGPNSLAAAGPAVASHADQMIFDFHGMVIDDGEPYLMWLATGTVVGELSGEGTGCKYSGSGQLAHSPWGWSLSDPLGYLEISPHLDSYFAEFKDDEKAFTGYQTCPEHPEFNAESTQSFQTLETLDPMGGRVYQGMVPTATALTGSYIIPVGNSGSAKGAWSFHAALP